MGKYKKGVLGPFRGKIGTVVGSVWKGIFYMRSLPDITDNPTPSQLNIREKMSVVGRFFKKLKPIIGVGYQHFTDGVTPMNAAIGYHLKNAVSGTSAANYAVDFEKVKLSVGDLPVPANFTTLTDAVAKVTFGWTNNAAVNSTAGTDKATFVVYCKVKDAFVILRDMVPRSALTYTMQLPLDFSQLETECWMFFVSIDGKQVSESVHIGPQMII